MKVSIIIVNYRTPGLTLDCLSSIHTECSTKNRISVIVADNDSRDGSVDLLKNEIQKRRWDSWVTLLPLNKNGGFAYGNNRILDAILNNSIQSDFIWLLNPDTVLRPGACDGLADFLSSNERIGIVGSRLEDRSGQVQISAFRAHNIVNEFLSGARLGVADRILRKWHIPEYPLSNLPHETDWVSGASMMVRREVFEEIGWLDEGYFMYFEEVDFCLRARKAGWGIWRVPQSCVVHLEGASTCGRDPRDRRRWNYWFQSRRRFLLKHYGPMWFFLYDMILAAGYGTLKCRSWIQGKPNTDSPDYLSQFLRNSFVVKGFRPNA